MDGKGVRVLINHVNRFSIVVVQDTHHHHIISRMRGHSVSISSWRKSWSRNICEEMVSVLLLHKLHHPSLPEKVITS